MTTISVITPTFRREDLLARCVQSVLAQEVNAEIEHIVVNDAGEPLAHAPWQDDPRVRVLETSRTERCVARNTGAALSHGDWLYFLDDDDYILPGAFAALLQRAAEVPEAVHVYGAYTITDETAQTEQTISPDVEGDIVPLLIAGEMLPMPAGWFQRRAFFEAGLFDPLIAVTEDADLIRRVGFLGPVARTPFVIVVARVHHPATTTSRWEVQNEYWNRGYEKCLRRADTLARVVRGTRQSPYWSGRCAREYVASARRALRGRDLGLTGSRLSAGLRLSLPGLLRPAFWRGVRKAAP